MTVAHDKPKKNYHTALLGAVAHPPPPTHIEPHIIEPHIEPPSTAHPATSVEKPKEDIPPPLVSLFSSGGGPAPTTATTTVGCPTACMIERNFCPTASMHIGGQGPRSGPRDRRGVRSLGTGGGAVDVVTVDVGGSRLSVNWLRGLCPPPYQTPASPETTPIQQIFHFRMR